MFKSYILILKRVISQKFVFLFIFLLGLTIISLCVRGSLGNGINQADSQSSLGQAFESSGARGRYNLVLSIVEDKSLNLSQKLADFGAPDTSKSKLGYVSIFTPGVAFILVPFYLLGKIFNFGQLATVYLIAVFSVLNAFLTYLLAGKLGINKWGGIFAGFLAIFASNTLAYSGVVSQHIFTTTLVLLSVNIVLWPRSYIKHLILWFIYGFSILLDWPNLILLFPVILYLLFTDVFQINTKNSKLYIKLHIIYIATALIFLVPVASYGYYNYVTTGNPLTFGQVLPRYVNKSNKTDSQTVKIETRAKNADYSSPFSVEKMPNGIYILTTEYTRGLFLTFSVFIFALFGLSGLYKTQADKFLLIVGIPLANILLYSMFGDVWGGWAFGHRYLIPSIPFLSILVAFSIITYSKNIIFNAIFMLLLIESTIFAALGAVSTMLIPPPNEASGLGLDPTIMTSLKFLYTGKLGSFIYNLTAYKFFTPFQYFLFIGFLTSTFMLAILFMNIKQLKSKL